MIAKKIDSGLTLFSKIASGIAVVWLASSITHQTGKLDKDAAQLPVVQSQVRCERSLAGFNAKLAQQLVILEKGQIPVDHCPSVPPAKSP